MKGFAPTCEECSHPLWEHDKFGCTHDDEERGMCPCELAEGPSAA